MEIIIEFFHFLQPYGVYSYFVMFGFLIACGFGLPLPEDVILIAGGILSSVGVCDFWTTLAVTMAGVLIGDGVVYFMGRHFGNAIKGTRIFRRVMTENVDAKMSHVFAKYGDKVVFMGRFMPGLRMPIFLTAGIYRVSPFKFFSLDGAAALISVPVWIWVGHFVGVNAENLERVIRKAQFGIYGLLGVIIVLFLFYLFLKRFFLNRVEH